MLRTAIWVKTATKNKKQIYCWNLVLKALPWWFPKSYLCMKQNSVPNKKQIRSFMRVHMVKMCLLLLAQMLRSLHWDVIISVYYGRMIALGMSRGHATECLLVNKQPAATPASTHHYRCIRNMKCLVQVRKIASAPSWDTYKDTVDLTPPKGEFRRAKPQKEFTEWDRLPFKLMTERNCHCLKRSKLLVKSKAANFTQGILI